MQECISTTVIRHDGHTDMPFRRQPLRTDAHRPSLILARSTWSALTVPACHRYPSAVPLPDTVTPIAVRPF